MHNPITGLPAPLRVLCRLTWGNRQPSRPVRGGWMVLPPDGEGNWQQSKPGHGIAQRLDEIGHPPPSGTSGGPGIRNSTRRPSSPGGVPWPAALSPGQRNQARTRQSSRLQAFCNAPGG